MGLLKNRKNIPVILFLAFLGFNGCSSLRLERQMLHGAEDWSMYGGDAGRCNAAFSRVEPPLAPIWEYDASAGFGSSSAAAGDSFLFVGNLQGEIHAVKIASGESAGVRDFGSAVSGTPAISGDMMYIALVHDEASLIAYNLKTGSVAWSLKKGDMETSPLLMGERLYITTLNGKLCCIDKKNGAEIWAYNAASHAGFYSIHSSPASDGNIVVFGCDNGQMLAIRAEDGKLSWQSAARAGILATPSISGGRVFAGSLDSTFYAFDATDGRRLWEQPLGEKIYASQAVDGGRVYVGTAGRKVYCLNAADGNVIWEATTSGPISAAPLLSGSTVYIGCIDKTLYALDKISGKEIWKYKASGRIKTVPIIFKGRLFLFAEDKSVIAFKHKEGE